MDKANSKNRIRIKLGANRGGLNMDRKERLALYEKLYFHEIDSREKLNARLQLPLALIVSFIGALAFMLQNLESKSVSITSVIFYFLLAFSGMALIAAVYFFVRSWYNNTYEFLPSAKYTDEYLNTLIKTYEPFERKDVLVEQYFSDYLYTYYIKCSSANTECNDRRSVYLHKTNTALICTAVLAFIAFIVFHFGDIDTSHAKKVAEVKIIAPVEIKGDPMSQKSNTEPPQSSQETPPPPPPPPPARLIREGVEVVKPVPPKK